MQTENTIERIVREQNTELSKKNAEIIELKQKFRNVERTIPEVSTELNMQLDAIRLDKAIRRAEKRSRKKEISDESFIKLSNCLAFLTQCKMPIVDKILGLSKVVAKLEKRQLNK